MLSCSSFHRSNCALARSQWTRSTISPFSTYQIHRDQDALTIIHPSSIPRGRSPKTPKPRKLFISLTDFCCTKHRCVNLEVCQLKQWKQQAVSSWIPNIIVGIPCHAVHSGMIMDRCINTVNSGPGSGLGLLSAGMANLVLEQSRFETQSKVNLVNGIACLSMA